MLCSDCPVLGLFPVTLVEAVLDVFLLSSVWSPFETALFFNLSRKYRGCGPSRNADVVSAEGPLLIQGGASKLRKSLERLKMRSH